MAAFGKENWAGVLQAGPEPADEGMRHPVRADVLRVINLHDISQHASVNDFLNSAEIWMETHLQANANVNAPGKRSFQKGHVFRESLSHGFFQKHVAAVAHCLKCYGNMQFVRRCNNHRLYVPGCGEELLN